MRNKRTHPRLISFLIHILVPDGRIKRAKEPNNKGQPCFITGISSGPPLDCVTNQREFSSYCNPFWILPSYLQSFPQAFSPGYVLIISQWERSFAKHKDLKQLIRTHYKEASKLAKDRWVESQETTETRAFSIDSTTQIPSSVLKRKHLYLLACPSEPGESKRRKESLATEGHRDSCDLRPDLCKGKIEIKNEAKDIDSRDYKYKQGQSIYLWIIWSEIIF